MTKGGPSTKVPDDAIRRVIATMREQARRYASRCRGGVASDFESVGNEAITSAVQSYDPERGTFEAFAYVVVRRKMRAHSKAEHERLSPALSALYRVGDELAQAWGPDSPDLSGALEDTPEQARRRAVQWARRQAISMGLASQLAAEPLSGEEAIIAREEYARAQASLKDAMATLPPRVKRFVEMFYWEGQTFERIAAELNVSSRTVGRLHFRGEKWLEREMGKRGVVRAPPLEGRPEHSFEASQGAG